MKGEEISIFMKFKEFCEKALSNDVICIVDDIIRGDQIKESVAAYRFILEDTNPHKPTWANDVLEREIERFSYGRIATDYKHEHFIVQLK